MAHEHHRHGRQGNPADLALMVKRQLDPARAAWQTPDRAVEALGLRRARDAGGPAARATRRARNVPAGGPKRRSDAAWRPRLATTPIFSRAPTRSRRARDVKIEFALECSRR